MMVRDERHNLLHNLPLYQDGNDGSGDFFDAYVIAVDTRTTDDTLAVLQQVIPSHIPKHIFNYTFDGFGPARTLVFDEAYKHFPDITHVLVADPDWRPNPAHLNKNDLDFTHDSYQFKIWDRNGLTTRYCNWLMRHQPNLRYDYYVHEFLRFPNATLPNGDVMIGGPHFKTQKIIPWEVAEAESDSSWHQTVGHGAKKGASATYKRFLFDIALLEREQLDPMYKDSAHTLYYLGAAYCALVEASEEEFHTPLLVPDFQLSPTQLSHVTTGMKYYRRRMAIWGTDGDRNIEMTWATLRWMAYNAFFILKDFPAAEEYYLECIDFDRDRADCKTELSRLYTWSGKHELAYRWALEAVLTPMPERSFSNNFYVYDCLSLVQACRAAVNLMTDQPVILAGHALSRDSDSAPPTTTYDLRPFALGHFLGVKAADQCVDGVQLERSDILPQLAATFEAIWVQHKYKEGAGEWDKVLHVEDICVDKDRDFESQSLVQLNGEHYFCEGGGAGGGEVAGEFTYSPQRQMFDNSTQGLGHLDLLQYHEGEVRKVLFLACELTYEIAVSAACEMSARLGEGVVVRVGLGGGSSGTYEAFMERIDKCRDRRVQGVRLEAGFGFNNLGGDKFDYVSVGSGLLNLDVLGEEGAVGFMGRVVGLLERGGGVGLLVHGGAGVGGVQAGIRGIREKALEYDEVFDQGVIRELYTAVLTRGFGYSSETLLHQVEHIVRVFDKGSLAELLGRVGLKQARLIGEGGGRFFGEGGSHIELYAGMEQGKGKQIKLGEETVVVGKGGGILKRAERRLRRSRGREIVFEVAGGEFAFEAGALWLDLLGLVNRGGGGGARLTLKEMYGVLNSQKNRANKGMIMLDYDEFMAEAIALAEVLNELGLVAIFEKR